MFIIQNAKNVLQNNSVSKSMGLDGAYYFESSVLLNIIEVLHSNFIFALLVDKKHWVIIFCTKYGIDLKKKITRYLISC